MQINSGLIIKNIITDGPPIKTERKVDGKDEYIKRINLGVMPNNTTKFVQSGLVAADITITDLSGTARHSDGTTISLQWANLSSSSGIMMNFGNDGRIELGTNANRSAFSGWVNICFIYN